QTQGHLLSEQRLRASGAAEALLVVLVGPCADDFACGDWLVASGAARGEPRLKVASAEERAVPRKQALPLHAQRTPAHAAHQTRRVVRAALQHQHASAALPCTRARRQQAISTARHSVAV